MDPAQERLVDQFGGLMFVANTIIVMNGTSNFWPVCSVRKSTRLSSGTIQRFSRSRGEQACRPKSSMTSTPPFATACTGAR